MHKMKHFLQEIHPVALFRLTVLGSLTCRKHLDQGELKRTIKELAKHSYNIPHSTRSNLSEKTIEAWYYRWKDDGIEALTPKVRCDIGQSKIPEELQRKIISLKKDNPSMSIEAILEYFQNHEVEHIRGLSNSSVHRLLQHHGLSHAPKAQSIEEIHYEKWKTGRCKHETWLKKLTQGKLLIVDLIFELREDISGEDVEKLYHCILNKPLHYRNRSICVLAVCKGIPRKTIAGHLCIAPSTVDNSFNKYKLHGTSTVTSDLKLKPHKHEKQEYIDKAFSILHAPPLSYGYNRTTWRLVDLKAAMEREGMSIGKGGLSKIIKNAGYSYRKAKTVLTSNDKDYKDKRSISPSGFRKSGEYW